MQPLESYFDKPVGATLVTLRAGRIGGQQGGGVIGKQDVGIGGLETATITYDLCFPAGMEWVKSGKLPGIYGGTVTDFAPSRQPNGANGFTVRPLWRPDGNVELYVWDMRPDPAIGGYGREFRSAGIKWQAGKWHRVALTVDLNTPGQANGTATLLIDGAVAVHAAGLEMRAVDIRLSGCFWCCFYGGGTLDYAPTRDQIVTIGDVRRV